MKEYSMYFYKVDGGLLLECRPCLHSSRKAACREAELYKAWAEVHYKCKVYYRVMLER